MSTVPGPRTAACQHTRATALSRERRRERTTKAFAELAASPSPARRAELLEYVIEINMGVARSVVSRYLSRGIEEEDLLQVGYAALTRAARDFDPSRHYDFLAYAVPTIRGEVKKHFRDFGWTIRPTRRVQEIQGRIATVEGELFQELGRSPRASELAERLDIHLDDVIQAMSADGCFTPSSLDRPVTGAEGGGTATVADLIGDADAAQAAAEARAALAPVVRHLKERDRRILYMRFFEDRTQQEIAEEIGVTQMQVSRLLARIMRDLRALLGDAASDPAADRFALVRRPDAMSMASHAREDAARCG